MGKNQLVSTCEVWSLIETWAFGVQRTRACGLWWARDPAYLAEEGSPLASPLCIPEECCRILGAPQTASIQCSSLGRSSWHCQCPQWGSAREKQLSNRQPPGIKTHIQKNSMYQTPRTTSGKRQQRLWSHKSLRSNRVSHLFIVWPWPRHLPSLSLISLMQNTKHLSYREGQRLYSKSLLSQCWLLWVLRR